MFYGVKFLYNIIESTLRAIKRLLFRVGHSIQTINELLFNDDNGVLLGRDMAISRVVVLSFCGYHSYLPRSGIVSKPLLVGTNNIGNENRQRPIKINQTLSK